MEWECCEQIWQLICSPLFIERRWWSPVCDKCGSKGLSWCEFETKFKFKEELSYERAINDSGKRC